MFQSNLHAPFFSDILEVASHICFLFPQDRGPPARRLENQNPVNPSRTLAARCCRVYATFHTWEIAKMTWRFKIYRSRYIKSFSFHRVLNILYAIFIYLINVHIAVSRTFPGDEVWMWVGAFGFRVSGRKNPKRRSMAKSGGTLWVVLTYLLTYLIWNCLDDDHEGTGHTLIRYLLFRLFAHLFSLVHA